LVARPHPPADIRRKRFKLVDVLLGQAESIAPLPETSPPVEPKAAQAKACRLARLSGVLAITTPFL
jgi:hypothetical protein